jgi:HEAT repeat protein
MTRRDFRFSLKSLFLFTVLCGLLIGAAVRLWRYYGPSGIVTTGGVRSVRLTAADVVQLAKNVKSPSVETRLDAAIALRRSGLGADLVLPLLDGLLRDESVEVRVEAIQGLATFAASATDHVPYLIAALDDEDARIRREAAFALWRIGPGPEAVPSLIDSMRDDDLRAFAIRTLGNMKPAAVAAVPALVQALEETEGGTRDDVIVALMNMGPAAEPAIAGLAELLMADQPLTRQRAAMALGKIGPAAVEAVPLLLDGARHDRQVRNAAIQALDDIDRADPSMLPELQQALKSDSKQVRMAAALLIRRIGPAASPAIPDLVELVRSDPPNDEVVTVALALKWIGVDSIPHLCQAMSDGDPKRRTAAACVIAVFGRDARGAVPVLTGALDDEFSRVRASAAMALGKIGADARDSVSSIVRLFKDDDPLVRNIAAWAAGEIGTDDRAPIEELLALTRDADPDVQRTAVSSLGEIHRHSDLVVPVLIQMLNTPDEREPFTLSRTLILALGKFGPDARAAIPRLIELMMMQGRGDHHAEAQALGEIGSDSDEVVTQLVNVLSKRGFVGTESVGRALRKLNPDAARDIVPSLIARLEQDPTDNKLLQQVQALAGIGPIAEESVPSLTMLLSEDCYSTVATALGEIGPASSSAVPAIIDRLQSSELQRWITNQFTNRGIRALGQIGPGARESVPTLMQFLLSEYPAPSSDLPPHESRTWWESRVKWSAWSLGQIGPASREAVPRLIELSHYIERTIQVPTPDRLERFPRLDGNPSDPIQQQTVSQVVRNAIEQIGSPTGSGERLPQ